MRSSQRELISCIWGTDLVVVARFRAAEVPRLCCGLSCSVRISSPTDMRNCPPGQLIKCGDALIPLGFVSHRTPARTSLPHGTWRCYYTNEREWIISGVGTKEFFASSFDRENGKDLFSPFRELQDRTGRLSF